MDLGRRQRDQIKELTEKSTEKKPADSTANEGSTDERVIALEGEIAESKSRTVLYESTIKKLTSEYNNVRSSNALIQSRLNKWGKSPEIHIEVSPEAVEKNPELFKIEEGKQLPPVFDLTKIRRLMAKTSELKREHEKLLKECQKITEATGHHFDESLGSTEKDFKDDASQCSSLDGVAIVKPILQEPKVTTLSVAPNNARKIETEADTEEAPSIKVTEASTATTLVGLSSGNKRPREALTPTSSINNKQPADKRRKETLSSSKTSDEKPKAVVAPTIQVQEPTPIAKVAPMAREVQPVIQPEESEISPVEPISTTVEGNAASLIESQDSEDEMPVPPPVLKRVTRQQTKLSLDGDTSTELSQGPPTSKQLTATSSIDSNALLNEYMNEVIPQDEDTNDNLDNQPTSTGRDTPNTIQAQEIIDSMDAVDEDLAVGGEQEQRLTSNENNAAEDDLLDEDLDDEPSQDQEEASTIVETKVDDVLSDDSDDEMEVTSVTWLVVRTKRNSF